MSSYCDRIMKWCSIIAKWCSIIALISAIGSGVCLIAAMAMQHSGIYTAATMDTVVMVSNYLLAYGYLPMTVVCATLLMTVIVSDTESFKRGMILFNYIKKSVMKSLDEFYSNITSCGQHAKQVLNRYINQYAQGLQPKTFSRHPNCKKKRSK